MRQKSGQLFPRGYQPYLPLLAAGLLILLGQAAVLQGFRQFASEAIAQQSSGLTDRRLFSQARVEAQRAAEHYPFNAYALFRIGASDFAAGSSPDHQRRAVPALEQALVYMPHKPNLLRLLGQSYYYLGDYDKAAATLRRFFIMSPKPETGAAHLYLIRALASFRAGGGNLQGQAVVPLTVAAGRVESPADLAVPHLLNAVVLNHHESAEALVRQWIAQGVEGKLTARQLQDLLQVVQASGKTAVLASVLTRVFEDAPPAPQLSKLLLGIHLRNKEADKARVLVKQLQERSPEDAELYLMLGDIELLAGKREEAVQAYQEHLRRSPASPARRDIEKKVGKQFGP